MHYILTQKVIPVVLFFAVVSMLLSFSVTASAKSSTVLTQQEVEKIVDNKIAAQQKEDSWIKKYNVKPILKTFVQYSLDLDTSAHQRRTTTQWDNAFDLTRFYFGFDADLTKHIMVEVKADINAKAAAGAQDSDFDIFLKTGFLEFGNFESAPGLKFVVGQADLPWIGYVEGVWGYRMQGQILTDYERYLASTDVGVGVKYEFPEKWGDLHFSFVNGTGFNTGPENDNYKDFHLRATVKPLANKNFFVSALGVVGFTGSSSNDHERFAGLIGYKDKEHGTIAGEVLYAIDPAANLAARHPSLAALTGNAKGLGFSGFGELKFFWWEDPWDRFSIIGRVDFLDPDGSTDNNYHYHGISGLAYTLNDHFKFLIDHDWSSYQAGAGQRGNNTLFFQMEAKL